MNALLRTLAAAALAIAASGCKPGKTEAKPPSPGPPARIITENDLASIVLKPEAEQRLGLATVPVELKKVGRSRTLGGELLLPLGRSGEAVRPAASAGKSIYSLLPAMTPTELVQAAQMQVDADGQVAAAQVQLEATKVTLARVENLVANKSGTQRAVDEARAQVRLAEAALQTARERRALLGAPLFDAVRQEVLWVRVPVYAGDLDQIDLAAPASVASLGNGASLQRAARPVGVPFSAPAAPATVDLFYEMDNADGKLRSGQKVTVVIPLRGEGESLVVPRTAVLYDIHGGAWVYENNAPHTFTRRRIEVRYANDAGAVLARGPKAGTKVVTDGATELFGAEFGVSK